MLTHNDGRGTPVSKEPTPDTQFPRRPLLGSWVNKPVVGLTDKCAPEAYTAGAAVNGEA